MSTRSQELIRLVDSFLVMHDEWSSDSNRPGPDEAYWESVDALTNAFASGGLPSDCRGKLADTVDNLAQQFSIAEHEGYFPDDHRWGHCWEVVEQLRDLRRINAKQAAPRRLESIAELRALPGMTDHQIAKMYGFIDPRTGEPQLWKVQDELDAPGKWTGSGTGWINPMQATASEGDGDVAEDGSPAVRARRTTKAKSKANAKASNCPESIEQLLLEGVSDEQVCRMKGCDQAAIDDARAEIERKKADGTLGLDESTSTQDLVSGTSGTSGCGEGGGNDIHNDSDELIRQQVVEMARRGEEPASIADTLKMTIEQVEVILAAKPTRRRAKASA